MINKTLFKRALAGFAPALIGILAFGNAQAGTPTVTTTNQYGAVPFTPTWVLATNSLIGGLAPTTAVGNFTKEGVGNVTNLTSGGSLTIANPIDYVTCGNQSFLGSQIIYTLPASAVGYNITNISVYGGWVNNGRDAQAYTVYYATAASPTTFTALTAVNYDPSASVPGGAASATSVTITDSAGGIIASNVVALEFDFTTPASLNGYCGYGAITVQGTGAILADPEVTTTNQYGAVPFTPTWVLATNSLIGGLAPTTAVGNFTKEGVGNVTNLTSGGSLTIASPIDYVTCGSQAGLGSQIVYTLPASAVGYNITNISVYGGWTDSGRDAQAYTVYYATAANPTTFTALTAVNYDPSASVPGGVASATCVTLADWAGGVLVSNVVALEFDFTTPASLNGYCGYGAITVQGTAAIGSGPEVTTTNQYGALPFTPTWTPAANSLIAGMPPTTALGNFSAAESGRDVGSLTQGGSLTISALGNGDCSLNYVTCGNGSGAGSNIVYTLPASQTGYNITNISVYGGWVNNGRDAQAYTVLYATAADPTNFTALTAVNFNPTVPANTPSATCATIAEWGGGVLASNVVAVEFSFTNPPSENGFCGYAAITVQGTSASGIQPAVTLFNQQGSVPFTPTWTPAADSLIAGLAPSTALGNFNVEGSANVNSLTGDGSLTIGSSDTNYVTCGNGSGAGSQIVYTLPTPSAITNISVYGGWVNNGRDAQAYTVYYATADNPATFTVLTSVNYLPSNSGNQACATLATITDPAGGVLVSNVVALMFDFTSPPTENGYCGYGAITAEGIATIPPTPPTVAIVTPTNGQNFNDPATVSLSASVTANGHTINGVTYYNGATAVGSSSTAPSYTATWNVGAGAYSLTAVVAYDSGSSVSNTVPVTGFVLGQIGPMNSMVFTHGSFQFNFTGPAGQPFRVLSTNLLTAPLNTWTVLTNATIGTNGIVSFTDTAATNKQQFYRLVSP